jgi:transposase
MQVEHPICCGIDVHKDTLTACLRRVEADGQVSKEGREFATTYPSLLALSDWLVEQHCPVVAMESTGVYSPALSMAIWVIPASANQSARARSSRVMVPKVCSSAMPSACWPVGSEIRQQAVILFVWTSNPAQCVNTTSMARLPLVSGWRDTLM